MRGVITMISLCESIKHKQGVCKWLWVQVRRCVVFTPTGPLYLEVQVQDVHLVHVLQPLTDLADEQHRVQLRQVVVLVDDSVKQLAALHTATSAS